MTVIVRDYFSNLFQKQASSRESVLSALSSSVTNEDNNKLTTPFTMEEFKEAVFSMQDDKCPGPDGFNPGFYKKFWDICGHEIYKCISWISWIMLCVETV
ncbi:CNGC5-like protein, partial [Trifolium medium]|nr:CNGC5-like protein [Trifolium medium]